MPASRWQTSFADLFRWMEDADADLMSALSPSMFPRLQKNKPEEEEKPEEETGPKYPDVLPILPLRG